MNWELTGVMPEKSARACWVAVWAAPGRVLHDRLPLESGQTSREDALAYAADNPPTWGRQSGDAWLSERARPRVDSHLSTDTKGAE